MEVKIIFKKNLYQLRREKRFSQEQLAEKLNVSRQAVSKWETGEAQPDMSKLLLLCEVFDISMDKLCGKETKNAEKPAASLSGRKKFNRLCLIFLAAGLILGFAGGYLGNVIIQDTINNGYIFGNLKITNFSFYNTYSGDSSMTLQIVFSPNISNDRLQYQVVKTDSLGNTIIYDADYKAGVCQCPINLDYYTGYTLTAVISDGKNTYSASLIKFDIISREGLTYQELWNK